MYESPFIKSLFGKLDVVPRMDHRHEYKNAMNFYTETHYTEPAPEAMKKLMDSQFGQMVAGIAKGRGLDRSRGPRHVRRRPVPRTSRRSTRSSSMGSCTATRSTRRRSEKAGDDAKLLYLQKYLERAGRPHDKGAKVALIYGVGAVQRGSGGFSPISGTAMGSDTVAAAFRAAREDDDVKAIVFRVDSPGGSYVASDTIWRETQLRARTRASPSS